jgi:hypothetical protein
VEEVGKETEKHLEGGPPGLRVVQAPIGDEPFGSQGAPSADTEEFAKAFTLEAGQLEALFLEVPAEVPRAACKQFGEFLLHGRFLIVEKTDKVREVGGGKH